MTKLVPLSSTEGALALLDAKCKLLERDLDMEKMNGYCIMECRDYIEKKLGATGVMIPGLDISSPYFDDIVYCLVNEVLRSRVMQQQYKNFTAQQQLAQNQTALQVAQTAMHAQAATSLANQQNATIQQAMLGGSINNLYFPVNTTSTASTTTIYTNNISSTQIATGTPSAFGAATQTWISGTAIPPPVAHWLDADDDEVIVPLGRTFKFILPNSAKMHVKKDGSYVFDDSKAKVIYKASPIRDFNRYLNVSDRLEEFIDFCGEQKVRADEMLDLPIKLFVGWLAIECAKADKEPEPPIKLIPQIRKETVPRCLSCGSFIRRGLKQARIEFCDPECFGEYYAEVGIQANKLANKRPHRVLASKRMPMEQETATAAKAA